MKLDYKILWIDDQFEGGIDASIEALELLLFDHGFNLEVEKRTKLIKEDIIKLAEDLNRYNQFDFIIFDYDLGKDSENGITIAKELRSKIYTDMIFYSSNGVPSLRQLLFDNQVDGVFLVSRRDFENEINPIVLDHIKRMSDINNMRGLLLDEVSQMDSTFRDKVIDKFNQLDPKQKSLVFDSLKEKVITQLNSTLSILNNEELTYDTLVSDYKLSEFNKVRMSFCKILKALNLNDLKRSYNDSSDLKEIQDLRNDFAHKKAIIEQNEVTLGGKTYTLDSFLEVSKQLVQIRTLWSN